jgi:pyrimidine operon attenuation protein/uracil phosphoribosyltransferase
MSMEKVKILSAGAINAKIKRMAFEVYERNFAEQSLLIVSIGPRGAFLADRLATELRGISGMQVSRANLAKSEAEEALHWEAGTVPAKEIQDGKVLVVDDVLYSGKTMFQAVAEIFSWHPKAVQVAVLIDRGHRFLPVSHDYVGMEMATSLKQYISVEIDRESQRAEAFIY